MKKTAKLKICVLGGRSFGKTSLLSSLLLISGNKESGITVSGDNQKKLNIYNDYKSNNGTLIATNWDDICSFKYNITGTQKKRWQVTFPDYPGEFFQKFLDDDSSAFSSSLKRFFPQKDDKKDVNERTFAPEEAQKARKLARKIEHADALIILLPADITEAAYKKNLQVFKSRLQALLERAQQCNPHIPVCLAINKWDMFERPMGELESVLADEPYREFNDMLQRECPEHYFPQAVSAFGNHLQSDQQKWDKVSQPQNVLEMLTTLSEKAEIARWQTLRERYEKSSKIARIFKYPFLFWNAYSKGANSEDDRKFCSNGLFKNTALLCLTVIALALAVFVTISTTVSVRDYKYIAKQASEAERIIAKFKSTEEPKFNIDKNRIDKFKSDMADYPHDLAFFCGSKEKATMNLIRQVEEAYNRRIYKLASEYCSFVENCDQEPSQMNSSERLARCSKRIKRWEDAKEKLTNLPTMSENGREIVDIIGETIAGEKRLCENIKKEKPLDDSLSNLAKLKKEEVCREIEQILDTFKGSSPHRKEVFERLSEQLDDVEKEYEEQLSSILEKYKDSPDSTDCEERIRLANSRINTIEDFANYYSSRSQYLEQHKKRITKERQLIEECQHDMPFYSELKKLQGIPEKGKIRKIDDFLRNYTMENYPRCTKYIDDLNRERASLIGQMNEKIATESKAYYVTSEMPAKEKIDRLTAFKTVLEEAYGEFTIGSEEYKKAKKEISCISAQLRREDKNKEFETEFNKLMDSADEGKLRRIEKFWSPEKFTLESYPDKKASFEKLEKEREQLIKKWNDYRTTAENENADNLDLSAADRSKLLDKLIQVYEKLKNEYCESSLEYGQIVNVLEKTREKQSDLSIYITFDKDLKAVENHDAHYQPKELDKFIQKYETSQIKEEKYLKRLSDIRNLYRESVVKIKKELDNEIDRVFKESEGASWKKQCVDYEQVIEIINKYRAYLPTKESGYFETKVAAMKSSMEKVKHYGQLTDAYMDIPEGDDPIAILNAIVRFNKEYKQSDYPEETQVFNDVSSLRKKAEASLFRSLKETINKIDKPDNSQFSKCVAYFTECRNSVDVVLKKLDKGTGDIYARIQMRHEEYSRKIELNERFKKVYDVGHHLTHDDGQSDIAVAKNRLSSIKAFKKDFPRTKNPEIELKPLYVQIDAIQSGIESFLAKYIERELDRIKDELPPAANNTQRIANLRRQLDFLKELTAIMVLDSPFYTIYNGKVNDIQNTYDETKLEKEFEEQRVSLRDNLGGQIPVGEKIKLIDVFAERFGKNEKFSAGVKEFTNRREQYNKEVEWENLASEIQHFVDKHPAEDAQTSVLAQYKSKINEYLDKVNKYSKISYLLSKTNDISKLLHEQIKYVEKAIGDGSYNDILKKERAYKKLSEDAQLQSLRNAIASFDREKYPQFLDSVIEKENKLDTDNKKYSAVEDAVSSFRDSPSKKTFDDLTYAIDDFKNWTNGYASTHPKIDKYHKYIYAVCNGIQVKLSLYSVYFSETWDDLEYYVTIQGNRQKYECTRPSSSTSPKQISKPGTVTLPYGATIDIDIVFDNYFHYKPINTKISYWEILKNGMNSGEFIHKFEGRNKKNNKGYLQFKISGVPELE